jgi:hypothetical protein
MSMSTAEHHLDLDDKLSAWAKDIAASLPPMTDAEIRRAARALAGIDAQRSRNGDPGHDIGQCGGAVPVSGSYGELPAA